MEGNLNIPKTKHKQDLQAENRTRRAPPLIARDCASFAMRPESENSNITTGLAELVSS